MDTLAESIYHEIRKRVISGYWQVEQRINEKELANELHVSRTPLRKALKKIYEEGLLDYTKNFGFHVRVISVDDVCEIYKIRIALEKIAFTEAMKKMDRFDEEEIKKLLVKSKQAAERKNHEELISCSNQFNNYIYKIAKMPRLLSLQTNFQNYLSRFRMISFSGSENDRSILAVKEHEAIFKAMTEKDEVSLNKLIDIHLNRSLNYITEVVSKENEEIKQKNIIKRSH